MNKKEKGSVKSQVESANIYLFFGSEIDNRTS